MASPPDPQTQTAKDRFALPSSEVLRDIARRQEERAAVIREQRERLRKALPDADTRIDEESHAAEVIQRNYRGHRSRRALKGYGLDPSTRWLEALKDSEFHRRTAPTAPSQEEVNSGPHRSTTTASTVRDRWKRVGAVAHHAGSDDTSDDDTGLDANKRRELKAEREKYAKNMGLEYFLEMVDHKHRYGSNLRRYHGEWKKSNTNENFFYWLDHGEGKELDLEDRPRKRLDTEQVRYLSREERRRYLVRIDSEGRFCWDKDGTPITTSADFKDSIHGIVRKDDTTPTWREVTTGSQPAPPPPDDTDTDDDATSSVSNISTGAQEDSSKYTNQELHDAKGLAKLNHVSVDSIMNHLLRKTTKQNTWIFVADTSFRLYVGIKQSGAFQHSSFLQGARVSAAGLVKIKRGQIRALSPLSGHYAPPVKNFRQFLKNLKAEGADLSRLNVSRSYAIILGLEGYVSVKTKTKTAGRGVKEMFDPSAKKKRLEAERDTSKSAEMERAVVEREERERKATGLSGKLKRTLKLDGGDEEAKAGAEKE